VVCGAGSETRTFVVATVGVGAGAACPYADGVNETRLCTRRACRGSSSVSIAATDALIVGGIAAAAAAVLLFMPHAHPPVSRPEKSPSFFGAM